MMKNAVSWVEIPVLDFERAKAFYSAIYDYEMQEMEMGPTRMGFFLCDQENDGVGGAIVWGEDNAPSKTGPRVYLNGGEDLTLILNRVAGAGGKVIAEKIEITPEFGYYATFEDTEGNYISLHSMA